MLNNLFVHDLCTASLANSKSNKSDWYINFAENRNLMLAYHTIFINADPGSELFRVAYTTYLNLNPYN